jgi:outer membrane protein TolC
MKLMVKQQELYLKASQNALLPNLDFSARMGFRDEDQHLYDSWSLFEYQDVRADLRLNLPLNLPSDRANYERSQIMVRQALTNLQQRERVIANDIDDAYRAQKTYLERTGVLQKNEELARKTYETMAGLAEYGQIDPFDSVQAQNDLTAASAARVRAEIEYVIAMAILDLAQGKPISEILKRYTPLGESAPE